MLVIGLTGGIGCGKSSVARIFAGLGSAVIDTDAIAHRITARGSPALAAIIDQFGASYLLPDGSLDRAALRQRIFSDPQAKEKLEAILHPRIRQQVIEEMAAVQAPYLILAIPLFFETGAYHELVSRVLVVDCDESQQISRTMARSGLTEAEVRAIMASQVSREKRIRHADDILSNRSSQEHLEDQCRTLHLSYLHLAKDDGIKPEHLKN